VKRTSVFQRRARPPSEPHVAIGVVVHYDPARGEALVITASCVAYEISPSTCGIEFARLRTGKIVECHATDGCVYRARIQGEERITTAQDAGRAGEIPNYTSPEQRTKALLDAAGAIRAAEQWLGISEAAREQLRQTLRFMPSKAELELASEGHPGYFAAPQFEEERAAMRVVRNQDGNEEQ
jgi:hypothetical protein